MDTVTLWKNDYLEYKVLQYDTVHKKRGELQHFVKKKCLDMWNLTLDKWHVTHEMWYVTCCGGIYSLKIFSSLALTVCDLWYFEALEERMTNLINEEWCL